MLCNLAQLARGIAKFAICEYNKLMRVITKAHIKNACEKYPEAKDALESWYQIISRTQFDNFSELKQVFRSVDKVGRVVVFNIKGNKFRLIAAVHFNTKLVYILEVMSHAQYDKDEWKNKYDVYK